MSILVLTSDTLIGTPAAGNIEYSSPIFAGTPIGTQRGIVPTQQYYRLNAAYVGTNVNTAQSLFGVGVTLSANTVYEFEMQIGLNVASGTTTSHTLALGFAGTATLNNIFCAVAGTNLTGTASGVLINSSQSSGFVSTASATVLTNSGGGTGANSEMWKVNGTVSINAGGTFIPQYTCSSAPGAAYSTVAGSYIRIAPLSASGANTNVGTWA